MAVTAAIGVGLAPVPARAQFDFPAQLKTIERVRFEGRHHVSKKELSAVLKTRNPSIWPWHHPVLMRLDFVRADTSALEQVCWQRGYLDAVVNSRLDPGTRPEGVVVTYVIHEGPRYHVGSVKVSGLDLIPEAPIRRHLFARSGKPYNPFYLYADTASIAAACREHGFLPGVSALAERRGAQGQAGSAEHDTTLYDIEYFVELGRKYKFGEVNLSSPGQTHVKPRLVLREIVFKPGETYKASEVQESIEQIYGTSLFNLVQMTPLPDSTNGVVEFDLHIRERRPRWLAAGVGSGTAERFRFTGEWGHRNLNARGLQAVVSSKLALDGNARFLLARGEATLYDPWLLRQRRRGSATFFIEGVHDRANPDFFLRQDSRGVNFQIRRDYHRFTRLVVTQANSYVHQRFDLLAADSARTEALRDSIPPHYSTHRLQLAVERDDRDDLINPFRGTYTNFTGDIAGGPLQGSSSFTRVSATTSWYVTVHGNSVLAFRVRAGSIDPFGKANVFTPVTIDSRVQRVPIEDRFRLGGVNSIRGYTENALPGSGGLAMLLANVELRVPLVGPFGAEFFGDAGNVWARPSFMNVGSFKLRLSDDYYDLNAVRYVAGMGLRLNLPFGPLRFDVSWSSQPDRGSREPGVPPDSKHQDLRDRRIHPQIAIGTTF